MKPRTCVVLLGFAVTVLAAALPGSLAIAAENEPPPDHPSGGAQPQAWTLDEALAQLGLYPRDAYLQYAVLQLARREGRLQEVVPKIDRLVGSGRRQRSNARAGRVDLFSIFSGALAVQESLQLDTMRGERPGVRQQLSTTTRPDRDNEAKNGRKADSTRPAQRVKVADLIGPTIKSHPWEVLLAGKKPKISTLARNVPEDFYFIRFRSLNKMLAAIDLSDLWGTHLFNQASQEARTQLVGKRLRQQLAVETNQLLRLFYDAVVDEVAVTGSDLFYREGSDVTLLFRFSQPEIFKARMNGFLVNAQKAHPEARRTKGSYLGVDYVHVAVPDRGVHVFSAYPDDNLHVRSNSRIAFQRVIEAIRGRNASGKAVRRLGETAEFAYIRTLMPQGAKEEDGFVYLSDPFIRRLVGPALKLTERRRMLCYNHLRMIGHAGLLYRTEHGKDPASLKELKQAGCTPGEFGQENLACPDGGKYRLSADGLAGVCSHHGHAHSLKPCCEIELQEVTREEANEYKAFLTDYNRYWRTFFDPIALRIQMTPQRYRLETIVLPLIDNSVYTGLANVLGGQPESLDALPVPKRNIFSLAVRFNKAELMRQSGLEQFLKDSEPKPKVSEETQRTANSLRQLGIALHNYHDVHNRVPTAVSFDKRGKKTLLSWRVHVLPYLGQGPLYRQFRLAEPWDSAHNKKLTARIPAVYRPANQKLARAGKTKFVAPLGEKTLFPVKKQEIRFRDVTDGTSHTIMLVEADDDHAVIWTKPDDLTIDLKQPLTGIAVRPPGAFLALFADGSVHFRRKTINKNTLAAFFTRAGGEVINLEPSDSVALRLQRRRRSGLFDFPEEIVDPRKLAEFLTKGIGNQVGLHVCDADPMFDFNLPNFLGRTLGSFNGRQGFSQLDEGLMIGLLISSLNAPVYVSVPVQDVKIVDEFLDELDKLLVRIIREQRGQDGLFGIEQDFYRMPLGRDSSARSYTLRFGPVKWRFFWGRIGNGLYIASKPFILEDLAAMEAGEAAGESNSTASDDGLQAHGMIRIRPRNWNRVVSSYRLGWEENNRQACLHNLGPLSSLSRSLTAKARSLPQDELRRELRRLAARMYDTHFFCPDEGRYVVSPDGKMVTCSVHGSATSPRQPAAPSQQSNLGKLMRDFDNMTLTLTFLEDGLHAVVNIDRK